MALIIPLRGDVIRGARVTRCVVKLSQPGSRQSDQANAPHTMIASPDDEDVISSRSSITPSIIGKAVDGTMAGPHCDPDYGPD
jgi:hypothetical protein